MKSSDDIESDISSAIERNDEDALRKSISEHSLAGTKTLDGWLSLASQLGHLAILNVLLEQGCDVNWANHDGETAFSYACACNQFAAAKTLHANGADINTIDSSGGRPLDWTVCHGHPEFRTWLRDVGGKRNFDYDEWPWPPTDQTKHGG